MAEAAGVNVGRIRSITEVPAESANPYFRDVAEAAVVGSVPVEPGTQELSVTVEVVYDIDQ